MEQQETSISPQEFQKVSENVEKVMAEQSRLQTSASSLRSDIEKLRVTVAEKVPKAVLNELEGKINAHTKALDTMSKKLFELQNSLNTFIQQPISHTLVDTMRRQLSEEILESVKILMNDQNEAMTKLIDGKITETRGMIQNIKKFAFR